MKQLNKEYQSGMLRKILDFQEGTYSIDYTDRGVKRVKTIKVLSDEVKNG